MGGTGSWLSTGDGRGPGATSARAAYTTLSTLAPDPMSPVTRWPFQ